MYTIVRAYLIDKSRKGKIAHYQELYNDCNLKLNMHDNPAHRAEIGRILGEISTHEHQAGRPLLSAVVLSTNMEEGDGFYKLCQELDITQDWRRLKRDDTFSAIEIRKCFDFWQDNNNYAQHA